MSINAFKNNQVVSLDDLTSSGNASKQQTNAIDKDLTKAIALEKITAVEVKKSEELSKKLDVNQEQLNKDKLAQEAESLDQSVNVSDAMKTISEFINMPVRTPHTHPHTHAHPTHTQFLGQPFGGPFPIPPKREKYNIVIGF